MRTLADLVNSRQNNFHLIRMVAASLVLISHSVALSTGEPELEPWRKWLGLTPGSVAVDVFFVVSGLLVTQSLDKRQDFFSFLRARFFRIWPGLLVALVLTTFGMSLWFSQQTAGEYLLDGQTWRFFFKNLLLISGVAFTLPGAFPDNPIPHVINGSLWSLNPEVRCYLGLAAAWWLVNKVLKARISMALVSLVVCLAFLVSHLYQLRLVDIEETRHRVFFMFFFGSAAYYWRQWVVLPEWLLPALISVLAASLLEVGLFPYVYSLLIPVIVISMAYQSSGPLLKYNQLGDYSYGIYIYAFPVQQVVAAAFPGCDAVFMTWVAGLGTLVLAAFSWHFVEKPGIRLGSVRK